MSEHNGRFSLLLTQFEQGDEVLEENGYESGGYACHGIAEASLRLRAPHLLDRVKFDPESSMFVAYGPDRAALEELAALLKNAMNDPALLQSTIKSVNPELMD